MTVPWTAKRSSSFVHFPFSLTPPCNKWTVPVKPQFCITQKLQHSVNISKINSNLLNSERSNPNRSFVFAKAQLLFVILHLQQSPTKHINVSSTIWNYKCKLKPNPHSTLQGTIEHDKMAVGKWASRFVHNCGIQYCTQQFWYLPSKSNPPDNNHCSDVVC